MDKLPSFFALSIFENNTNNWPNVNSDNPSGSISIVFPGGPGNAPTSDGVFCSESTMGSSIDSGSVETILLCSVVACVSKSQMKLSFIFP